MKAHCISFGGIKVDVPTGWADFTSQVEGVDPPFTLADLTVDIGALQFSIAIFTGGPVPNPTPEELLAMARELGERHFFSDPHDLVTESNGLRLGAVSYRMASGFVRIWYVSDGQNFAKITYNCNWEDRFKQQDQCEAIVRSVRFV